MCKVAWELKLIIIDSIYLEWMYFAEPEYPKGVVVLCASETRLNFMVRISVVLKSCIAALLFFVRSLRTRLNFNVQDFCALKSYVATLVFVFVLWEN